MEVAASSSGTDCLPRVQELKVESFLGLSFLIGKLWILISCHTTSLQSCLELKIKIMHVTAFANCEGLGDNQDVTMVDDLKLCSVVTEMLSLKHLISGAVYWSFPCGETQTILCGATAVASCTYPVCAAPRKDLGVNR